MPPVTKRKPKRKTGFFGMPPPCESGLHSLYNKKAKARRCAIVSKAHRWTDARPGKRGYLKPQLYEIAQKYNSYTDDHPGHTPIKAPSSMNKAQLVRVLRARHVIPYARHSKKNIAELIL